MCRGKSYGSIEQIDKALADYNKAIELDPNYASAYLNRGNAKLLLNQKDSACLDFSKAGELGNESAYESIKENCN